VVNLATAAWTAGSEEQGVKAGVISAESGLLTIILTDEREFGRIFGDIERESMLVS
jgi:hypothetical protein